jgi:hypothetical protein
VTRRPPWTCSVPVRTSSRPRWSLSTADTADVSAHHDDYHHGLEHATQAETPSGDFLRRFCVIGSPDRFVQRLRRLIGLGLSHVTVVGGCRDIDSAVRERSDRLVAGEVLPALRSP